MDIIIICLLLTLCVMMQQYLWLLADTCVTCCFATVRVGWLMAESWWCSHLNAPRL